MNKKNETALVTGASGGIGYALAKCFAEDGYDLVIVSRNREKLNQIAETFRQKYGIGVTVLAKDLFRPNAPSEIFIELHEKSIPVDVLVNNAGFGMYGYFADLGLPRQMDTIQLNIATLTHLTKLFLPAMIERRKGKILNLASTAAFQPGPIMAVYYATKAYVLSFSEALAEELKGCGIQVSVLCPGPTESDFQEAAGIDHEIALFKVTMMTAERVAKIGYRGLMKGKRVIVPGFTNWLFATGQRLIPRSCVIALVRFLQERKKKIHNAAVN